MRTTPTPWPIGPPGFVLDRRPFQGPLGTVRVGRIITDDATFVINPTQSQMEYSDLDLLVSGHSDGVNMIEVGAAEVPDEDVLAAIKFGYEEGIKPLLELQQELMEKCGTTESRMGNLNLPSDEIAEKVKRLLTLTSPRPARSIRRPNGTRRSVKSATACSSRALPFLKAALTPK